MNNLILRIMANLSGNLSLLLWKSKLFGNMKTQAAHDLETLIQDSISEHPSFVSVPQSLSALLHTTSSGYVSEYLFSYCM